MKSTRTDVRRNKEKKDRESKRLHESTDLFGSPLAELDPFCYDDTFCVVARRFRKNVVHRFSCRPSLGIFGPCNSFRRFCVSIAVHQAFEIIVMLVIMANCIALGFPTNKVYYDRAAQTHFTQSTVQNSYAEWTFLVIYTFELIIKIVAKGFLKMQYSYLTNKWNWIDFGVVSIAYGLEVMQGLQYASGVNWEVDFETFRTFRVLRAIKAISIIPGLRMIINSMANAFVQLMEVMFLTLVCICCFALMATQVYMGKLQQVCVLSKGSDASNEAHGNPSYEEIDPEDPRADFLYAKWINNRNNWLYREEPIEEYRPCGNDTGTRLCPEGYQCLQVPNGPNPNAGWTSFDNIFLSVLSTFQIVTLDYWERLYEIVLSAIGPWSILFFVLVVFLGSFYLMNLLLAVVARSYEAEVQKEEEDPLTQVQKFVLHRSDSSFSIEDLLELDIELLTDYQPTTRAQKEAKTRAEVRATLDDQTEEEKEARMAATGNLTHAIWSVLGRTVSGRLPVLKPHEKLPRSYQSKDDSEDEDSVDTTNTGYYLPNEADPNLVRKSFDPNYIDIVITRADLDAAAAEAERFYIPEAEKTSLPSESQSSLETLSSTASELKDQEHHKKRRKRWQWDLMCTRSVDTERTMYMLKKEKFYKKIIETFSAITAPIVEPDVVEVFITICIIMNTILLSSEYYGMGALHDKILEYTGLIFTVIFTLECILKLRSLRGGYFEDKWNVFDFCVVLISFSDFFFDYIYVTSSSTSFRSVRLLRIFKLAQKWVTMKILMGIVVSTFTAMWNLTILLLIIIYIFAVIGMQTFGDAYRPEFFSADGLEAEGYPRWNFSNFWHAFMIVFRVVCGEWIEPLWDCLTCFEAQEQVGWRCFFIFIPILIVGNFIVLNLFLALLLSSFNSEELVAQAQKQKDTTVQVDNLKKVINLMMLKIGDKGSDSSFGKKSADNEGGSLHNVRFKAAAKKVTLQNRKQVAEKVIQKYEEKQEAKKVKAKHRRHRHRDSMDLDQFEHPFVKEPDIDVPEDQEESSEDVSEDEDAAKVAEEAAETGPVLMDCVPDCPLLNYSCVGEGWKGVRLVCLRIVTHSAFEWIILLLICGSSITLCFEDVYLDQPEYARRKVVLFTVNNIFTALFVIEMLLKFMGMGLYGYFTNFWTLLDIFIVLISLVTFGIDMQYRSWEPGKSKSTAFQSLKALRTLRALRPLRAISRWQGMKVVVNALLYAIPSIFNVLLVCMLFWLIFAIMGVQFFKGKFHKCIDTESGDLAPLEEAFDMTECCSNPKFSWINISPNFDNVGIAYLSLFQVATFEGWMEVMTAASDIPSEIGQSPKREQTYHAYGFFVVFIIFGAFFTLNLFVGVIIDNFNTLKRQYEGNALEFLLSPGQQNYYIVMRKLGKKKAARISTRPKNPFCNIFFDISMSHRLEVCLFGFIFFNVIGMAAEYQGESIYYADILQAFFTLCNCMYLAEAFIRLMGTRHHYFFVPWNVFDFILAVFSLLDIARVELAAVLPFPPALLRVIRVFRITRILRLVKTAKGIRKLLYALTVSLPALFNIGALLSLITFIYSIIGMALFKDAVLYRPLDDVFSFQTFPQAYMLLFRVMTAAGWNDILAAFTDEEVYCGKHRKLMCGRVNEPACIQWGFALIFLITYVMVNYLIIINMYIAIILENFDEANRDEEIGIEDDDLEMFYSTWARYDPKATQFISFSRLSDFLAALDEPFKVPRPNVLAVVAFNLPIARGNKIHCLDILYALVKNALGGGEVIDTESPEFQKVQLQMELKFRQQFPERKLLDIISSTRIWRIQHNAAVIIQRFWRAYIVRTRGRSIKKKGLRKPHADTSKTSSGSGGFANAMNRLGQFFHVGGGSDKENERRKRRSTFRIPASPRRTSLNPDGYNNSKSRSFLQLPPPYHGGRRLSLDAEIEEVNRETRKRRGSLVPKTSSQIP